jgi:hypothetical protein
MWSATSPPPTARLYNGLTRRVARLLVEHRAELGERVGRIVEYSQHRFAILRRESNEILFGVERQKEHISGVLEPGSEQELSQKRNVRLVTRSGSKVGPQTERRVRLASVCLSSRGAGSVAGVRLAGVSVSQKAPAPTSAVEPGLTAQRHAS